MSRRTTIVATVGPAICSSEQMKKLVQTGANVFRLNFSHSAAGSREEYLFSTGNLSLAGKFFLSGIL